MLWDVCLIPLLTVCDINSGISGGLSRLTAYTTTPDPEYLFYRKGFYRAIKECQFFSLLTILTINHITLLKPTQPLKPIFHLHRTIFIQSSPFNHLFQSIIHLFTMFTSIIVLGLSSLLNLVAAQTCVPNAGVRREYNLTFDDLDTTTNAVIPAPYTYNFLTFDPASWSVARNGSNIPFVPRSMSNALVTGPDYSSTVAEFSTLCSQDSFDLVSLYMIGCWVNPKYFANDTACLVNFSGTKTDGTVLSFERPVRKTSMEIIQDFPKQGFVGLKSFKMTTRFEIAGQTTGIPAGRIGLDNIVIERQDGKVTC